MTKSFSIGSLLAKITGCASFEQKPEDVLIRGSGEKLHFWQKTVDAAQLHLPYAWAALSAYENGVDEKRKAPYAAVCACPDDFLANRLQWTRWTEVPSIVDISDSSSLQAKMFAVHLRVEVWSNSARREVIVAFGGTVGRSLEDWKSNFRWIDGFIDPHDAYSVLSKEFAPAFVRMFVEKAATAEFAWLKTAAIVSTGHSLGGGLAQDFAYALPADPAVPRVQKVFAFDPSPVSGKRGNPTWGVNARGLSIYRIYNRGEILATLRSVLGWVEPFPTRQGQTWFDIRYEDDWSAWTPLPSGEVHAHSMCSLAGFLRRYAEEGSDPSP